MKDHVFAGLVVLADCILLLLMGFVTSVSFYCAVLDNFGLASLLFCGVLLSGVLYALRCSMLDITTYHECKAVTKAAPLTTLADFMEDPE